MEVARRPVGLQHERGSGVIAGGSGTRNEWEDEMPVRELDDASFETEVIKGEKPAVVDFWAPWCGPCRVVSPIVEELAEEYGPAVNFFKINVDDHQGVAARFGIQGIPTILFFKDGEVVDGQIGAVPKNILSSKVASAFRVSPIAGR
jgi:thioredoxin 1